MNYLLSLALYGILIRLIVYLLADFLSSFDGVSILNPYNRWENVKEGVKLYELGYDPYEGDIFHENPIDLRFFYYLNKYIGQWIFFVFMAVQFITSIHLYKIGEHIYIYTSKIYNCGSINFSNTFFAMYFLNPIIIIMCTTQSTSSFLHLILCSLLYNALKGNLLVSSICLSILQLHHYHALILLIPVGMLIHLYNSTIDFNQFKPRKNHKKHMITPPEVQAGEGHVYGSQNVRATLILLTILTTTFTAFLSVLCHYLGGSMSETGSWNYLGNCLIDKFYVTDYTPNLGMSWYTFAESFPHFHSFFVWIFRLPCFIYVIPLSIKYRSDPFFLFYISLLLLFAFDPYPNLGDLGLALSLFPAWYTLFPYMRNTLVYICLFLASIIVAPVVWYLWIYSDSGNANFYYAMSMLYTLAQILFTSDLLFAHNFKAFVGDLKKEQDDFKELKHSIKREDVDLIYPF